MSEYSYTNPTSRVITKFLGVLIIAALLAGTLPQMASAVTCARFHNVVSGDTLSALSVTYDVSIEELAAANNLQAPYTLIIDQRLCIPGSTTSSPEDTSSSSSSNKPIMAVERDGNRLAVTVANFPKQNSYYVKIKKGHMGNQNRPWVKIGMFRTKKNNDVRRDFRLPRNFYNPSLIQVCLKNATSDAVLCVPYWE